MSSRQIIMVGHVAVVRTLLLHNPDVTLQNDEGTTALGDAIEQGHVAVQECLENWATMPAEQREVVTQFGWAYYEMEAWRERQHGRFPSHLQRQAVALVLAPTRELAIKIGDEVAAYAAQMKLRHTVIFGGVRENRQISALKRGLDVLIATPGRLLDLHNRRFVDLSGIEYFVLDEADRMLDMGFEPQIRRIVDEADMPREGRQTMMFSATFPRQE